MKNYHIKLISYLNTLLELPWGLYSKDNFNLTKSERVLNKYHYGLEKIKERIGLDYADILLKFLELNKIPKFKYVLVDELQDVNKIEAEIELKSGDVNYWWHLANDIGLAAKLQEVRMQKYSRILTH